ncbi:MAG: hypothetical protein KJ804_20745 [Proteobacteria bacterium]|nr:hypothetical protein [Pseudomonadota bacterium]MBU1060737.1 hypothetical protein [Pseudomonadota bacterium]
MAQLVSNQFRAVLVQEGRGAQTRLANEQRIDRGYLHAIVKGRKPVSDNIRAKIAAHFNMAYEDMLALGRRILEGGGEQALDVKNLLGALKVESPQLAGQEKEIIAFKNHKKIKELPSGFSSKILKVKKILDSGTSYGDLLAGLIDTFHEVISTKEENFLLRNRLKGLEVKMANLEKRIDDTKSFI